MHRFVATLLAIGFILGPSWADDAPERTQEARDALSATDWQEAAPGLWFMRVTTPGFGINAVRVDPAHFRFLLAVQETENGEYVDHIAQREGAVVAVNGGFFGEHESNGKLFPVGLLRIGGKSQSSAWSSNGGFVIVQEEGLRIMPSSKGAPDGASDILQSKPVLVDPGGVWAMNTNRGNPRPRSLLCLLDDGEAVVVVISGIGMSLYESGWLMRDKDVGGFFGCDSAIALDGGGSTQLWVSDRPEFQVQGESRVHNALVVVARD